MLTKECISNRCFTDKWNGHRSNCKLAIKQRIRWLKENKRNEPDFKERLLIQEMIDYNSNKLKEART